MKDLDDEALMRAYQTGDLAAFEALYRRNAGRVYGYLKQRLKRPEERDEVFQQIFLKLHRSRSGYSREYSFSQWLFVISKSVLLDYIRQRNRSPSDLTANEGIEIEEVTTPLSQEDTSGSYKGVEAMESLNLLPPEHRQVVSWRVLEELSYEEIAAKLNRSEVSVRQILSRALKKLRQPARLKESK
jgi:RNA polymerase sigma factor (sigma-70 family)